VVPILSFNSPISSLIGYVIIIIIIFIENLNSVFDNTLHNK